MELKSDKVNSNNTINNAIALRMAKTPLSFGHSEYKRVKYQLKLNYAG